MTIPHPDDLPESTIDNVGKPLDFVQIKLVDPKTNLVVKLGKFVICLFTCCFLLKNALHNLCTCTGEQGELWCRGHNVMLGYWKDEEKTKKEITNCKWFKSG